MGLNPSFSGSYSLTGIEYVVFAGGLEGLNPSFSGSYSLTYNRFMHDGFVFTAVLILLFLEVTL